MSVHFFHGEDWVLTGGYSSAPGYLCGSGSVEVVLVAWHKEIVGGVCMRTLVPKRHGVIRVCWKIFVSKNLEAARERTRKLKLFVDGAKTPYTCN